MSDNKAFSTLTDHQWNVLRKFEKHGVKYLVFGGYAVRYHGYLRAAKDLDLLIEPSEQNVQNVCIAFANLGVDNLSIFSHLMQPQKVLRWNNVDIVNIINVIRMLQFPELSRDSIRLTTNSTTISVICKKHLILNKKLAIADHTRNNFTRQQDSTDLKYLEDCGISICQ